MSEPSAQPQPPPPATDQPPPRAFAQGTGILLQGVGVTMFLMTCCVCSTSFLWDPVQSRVTTMNPQEIVKDPARSALAVMIVMMSVGGLAMASFGLGLQADRRRAAVGAAATTLFMLAVLIAVGVGLWMGESGWPLRLFHALLTLAIVILNGFTLAAWRQVRREPPPMNIDVVPPGTKIPYSFYHDDPPEVRLAKELANRRAKLDEERATLDKLEKQLNNDENGGEPDRDPKK